jgi:hypothetical protein
VQNVTLHTSRYTQPEAGIKRFLPLFFILIVLLAGVHADKGQSIMFGDPDPFTMQPVTNAAEQEKTYLCKQLRRDMDALKGKPQQRNAVIQRYRLECEPPSTPQTFST